MTENRKAYEAAIAALPKQPYIRDYPAIAYTPTRQPMPHFREMSPDEAKAWLLKDLGLA